MLDACGSSTRNVLVAGVDDPKSGRSRGEHGRRDDGSWSPPGGSRSLRAGCRRATEKTRRRPGPMLFASDRSGELVGSRRATCRGRPRRRWLLQMGDERSSRSRTGRRRGRGLLNEIGRGGGSAADRFEPPRAHAPRSRSPRRGLGRPASGRELPAAARASRHTRRADHAAVMPRRRQHAPAGRVHCHAPCVLPHRTRNEARAHAPPRRGSHRATRSPRHGRSAGARGGCRAPPSPPCSTKRRLVAPHASRLRPSTGRRPSGEKLHLLRCAAERNARRQVGRSVPGRRGRAAGRAPGSAHMDPRRAVRPAGSAWAAPAAWEDSAAIA